MKKTEREPGFHDFVALDEIELYGEVLSAVAVSDRPLTRDELDAVLGIGRQEQRDLPRPLAV